MNENGFLLFSKSFGSQIYDDNLLIGFFTSVNNFSREALGTAVNNVNLGEDQKLILVSIEEEGIIGAAIVHSKDNDQLVNKIVKNILHEFIDSYSPNYDPEKIFSEEMDEIIENNLREKVMRSPLFRFILSWVIVVPITYFLVLASLYVTLFLYTFLDLERFVNPSQLFTRFLPALIALSAVDMIILFIIPNLILGYLSPNWKIGLISSVIHLILTITLFFFSFEPVFTYIIIGYLPLAMIFSFFFLFVGIRLASKRFLKK